MIQSQGDTPSRLLYNGMSDWVVGAQTAARQQREGVTAHKHTHGHVFLCSTELM